MASEKLNLRRLWLGFSVCPLLSLSSNGVRDLWWCVVMLCGEQNMSNIFEKFQVACHALGRSLSRCLWISVVSGLSSALMFLGRLCLLKYRGWKFSAFRWRFIWERGVVLGVVLLCSMSDVIFMGFGLLPWTGDLGKSSLFLLLRPVHRFLCLVWFLLCSFGESSD